MQMTEPKQRRHKSVQEVGTPPEFIAAVEKRWGKITYDLAAGDNMHVCDHYFTPRENALKQDWTALGDLGDFLFCNPPYGNIKPWVQKACASMYASSVPTILMLGPAAIETKWFRNHVHGFANVHILVPRLKFVGHKSNYTKGLVLCEYPGHVGRDMTSYWDWRK